MKLDVEKIQKEEARLGELAKPYDIECDGHSVHMIPLEEEITNRQNN